MEGSGERPLIGVVEDDRGKGYTSSVIFAIMDAVGCKVSAVRFPTCVVTLGRIVNPAGSVVSARRHAPSIINMKNNMHKTMIMIKFRRIFKITPHLPGYI